MLLKGRITKGVGGLYTVNTENGVYEGRARGIFRKDNITPLIGDFVQVSVLDEDTREICIESICERKTELIRPRVANVDQVVIVFATKGPNINFDLLDRYIVLAEEVGIDIVICINKCELVSADELVRMTHIYSHIGYKIIGVSAVNNIGIEELREALSGKVTVFAGPSGVGKSSITNIITPGAGISMETGEISQKIQRGKHTTRHSELFEIDSETFIVDSPGFTSLSLSHIPKDELRLYFKEFLPLQGQCKFVNCMHIKEVNCAVKNDVGRSVSEQRYNRYVQFVEETDFRRN